MDPKEDQALELEALEAIFGDEFRLVEAPTKSSGARFEVDLTDNGDGSVKLRLVFTHALGYPDEPLGVVVHALEGLPTPMRKRLQVHLEGCAKENVQNVAVYALCEEAKDWLDQHVVGKPVVDVEEDGPSKFETLDATQQDKVEVISSKAIGTPVTPESFAEWRAKFEAEIEALKTKEEREMEENQKMTGRQMFESKIVVVSAESESFWEAEASEAAGG